MNNMNNNEQQSSPLRGEQRGACYLVTKETTATRQCPDCGGTGHIRRQFQGAQMKVVCTTCKATGVKKITHRTEVSLEEALKELGLTIND